MLGHWAIKIDLGQLGQLGHQKILGQAGSLKPSRVIGPARPRWAIGHMSRFLGHVANDPMTQRDLAESKSDLIMIIIIVIIRPEK